MATVQSPQVDVTPGDVIGRHAPSGGPHPPLRLPRATRWFHWATVVLLVAMFALIWTSGLMTPGPLSATLVNAHRSIGLVLFALVLARLAWRLSHPLPPMPDPVPAWDRRLAAVVQGALYASLMAMPPLGWLASAMAGDTVRLFGLALPDMVAMNETGSDRLFAVHGWVATALLALAGLHVAGAMRHHLIERDRVLERML